MPVAICVHEPIGEIRVLHRVLAEDQTGAHAAHEVGRVRHRLHATRDHDSRLARGDLRRREHHRLESGPADLVHRGARDAVRDAGAERRLARGRLADAGLDHVTHEDLVDVVGPHTGTLERATDGDRAELRRGHRRETAEERADRRARGAEDHRGHLDSARRLITCVRYERISSRSAVSSARRSLTVVRCASRSSTRRGRTFALVRCRP